MDDGLARVEKRMDKLESKFDRLTWGLVASAIGIIATRSL
jgi:hypothetical protein